MCQWAKGAGKGSQNRDCVEGVFQGSIACCNWQKGTGWIAADTAEFPPQVKEKMEAMINLAKERGQTYQERPLFFRIEDCHVNFNPHPGARVQCRIYTTGSQAGACEIQPPTM